jgi:4-aminobutyrate--pyruvate transaminase
MRATALVNNFADLNRVAAEGVREIVSGHGVFVRDAVGHEFLDGISGLWSASLGFSEKELVDAATDQLARLPGYHIAADKATTPVLELCERLAQLGPGEVKRVLLTNSGSEANDTQIKLLNYLWRWRGESGRSRFIARAGAFHGSTLGAGSLSDQGASGDAFGLTVLDVARISAPCRLWNGLPGETEPQYVARLAAELEQTLLELGPETVAGIFLEPVMGAGGIVVPPPGYYAAVHDITRRYGIRLIADEVICGYGRTGRMWGCDTFGITPDSTSCAKGITSGYLPLGAVLVDSEMDEALLGQSRRLGTFAHGFTTGGHPVTAAVALRTLDLFEERGIVANAAAMGTVLHRELTRARDLPGVGDVRGVGLLAGIELTGQDAPTRVQHVVTAAASAGLIVRGLGSTVCLCPPLIVSEDEVMLLVRRLLHALTSVAALAPPPAISRAE